MNYRSINDLNRCILVNVQRLPRDIEIVVGIPRSGLLAANLIALHLNLPLADLDGFLQGRLLSAGRRLRKQKEFSDFQRVLLVDDSVFSGEAMEVAKRRLLASSFKKEIITSCIYIDPLALKAVDFFFDICPTPRVFEWNIFHHPTLKTSCMDIDGVLCRDPTEEENDDGDSYLHFLTSVRPLMIPSVTVGYLVTCRLEKYREQTEAWLNSHNIKFDHLVMMDLPSKAARLASGGHARFKASVYTETGTGLFIESSLTQASQIVEITGKHVFCTETHEMIAPSMLAVAKKHVREESMLTFFSPKALVRRGRRALGLLRRRNKS